MAAGGGDRIGFPVTLQGGYGVGMLAGPRAARGAGAVALRRFAVRFIVQRGAGCGRTDQAGAPRAVPVCEATGWSRRWHRNARRARVLVDGQSSVCRVTATALQTIHPDSDDGDD